MLFPAEFNSFTFLLLTKPKAFLLLSLFYIESRDKNSLTFVYFPQDLSYAGHRKVLTKSQIRAALPILEEMEFISITKTLNKSLIEVTLLHKEFLYE